MSTSLGAIAVFAASMALPQETAIPGHEAREVEEIVVTGSRIRRRDFTSVSPIATVDADDVRFGGITNLEDLVNGLPQLVPNLDRTGNNPFNGAAQLDLRGLGPGRTLIMLNGRRAAPHDVFGAVNINNIPSALVERVEVVTGGASAVYGSDAVSGVVNFILDDSFTGMEFSSQYGAFSEGDGDVLDVTLSLGGNIPGNRGHLMGFANFQDRKSVLAEDREFTRVSLSENLESPTGELVPGGSSAVPGGAILFPATDLPGFEPTAIIFDPDGTARPFANPGDLYNFQPANYLQIPHRRRMLGAFSSYRITDDVVLFGELIWSNNETARQLAPSPFRAFVATNVDHPSLTPDQRSLAANNWDADGDGIANFVIARRLSEVGPRIGAVDSDSLRAVSGLEGEFAFGWDWEFSYSYSETDKENRLENGVYASRLQQGLLADPVSGRCLDPSNACVPISLFGDGSLSAEGVEFLRAVDIADTETVQEQILSFNTNGELLDLPVGPLSVAAGAEWRKLSSELVPDPALIGGGILGYSSESGVDGAFNVREIYSEALIPLLSKATFADYLGVEAGIRYSSYSVSGDAWNWKFGIDWAPAESLRFRAMYQRATRAPNIDELFRTPVESEIAVLGLFDECSASRNPVANRVAELCVAQGVPADRIGTFEAASFFPATMFHQGGNTNLDPEKADTYTTGLVLQPTAIPDLSLAVDYYDIEIANAIGATSVDGVIALCFDSTDINSDFCRRIVRGPSGDIVELTNPQFNLAKSRARGVDIIAEYRRELPQSMTLIGDDGSIAVRFFGTHAIDIGQQETPDSPFIDCAGFFGGLCVNDRTGNFIMPENRTNTRLTYYSGPLSVSLSWEWIGELDNHIDIANRIRGTNFASELDKAGARNYMDLSMRVDVNDSIEIYGGVSNVFEESPPLLGFGATQSNTAPQLYDVFGRRFFVGFSYRRG